MSEGYCKTLGQISVQYELGGDESYYTDTNESEENRNDSNFVHGNFRQEQQQRRSSIDSVDSVD